MLWGGVSVVGGVCRDGFVWRFVWWWLWMEVGLCGGGFVEVCFMKSLFVCVSLFELINY